MQFRGPLANGMNAIGFMRCWYSGRNLFGLKTSGSLKYWPSIWTAEARTETIESFGRKILPNSSVSKWKSFLTIRSNRGKGVVNRSTSLMKASIYDSSLSDSQLMFSWILILSHTSLNAFSWISVLFAKKYIQ